MFLRLLGLVYLTAFGSFWPQIVGLIGANGVSPSAPLLAAMHADYGWKAYLYAPSLFWLVPKDAVLEALCGLGCAAAVLLMLGLMSRMAAVCAYVLYLSIVTIGPPFTSFQWDALLLETGFLAIFAGASWLAIAYRLLLFRLMFESGVVKLTSGDPNWRNSACVAVSLLYAAVTESAGLLCRSIAGVVAGFVCVGHILYRTGSAVFLFAFPTRVRQVAAALLVLLQVSIALTGNFAFFNLLSIVLCLWALDDRCFERWGKWRKRKTPRFTRAMNPSVAAIVVLSLLQLFGLEPSFLESFSLVNVYGLFAVMTTSRTELVIEGSNDNSHWESYSFRYKPGDVYRSLPVVAPLQPRLDWQMWFAALGSPVQNEWTKTLVYNLLRGEPETLRLLGHSPFAKPPRSIRILAYTYCLVRLRAWQEWCDLARKLLGVWFGPVSDRLDGLLAPVSMLDRSYANCADLLLRKLACPEYSIV